MGKILFVIAPSDFRDEELFDTKGVLEDEGFETTIASTEVGEAVGMLGGRVDVNIAVSQINPSEYDAIVFVGGQGVESNKLYENNDVIRLAKGAESGGKIIGAICIAPRILASADLVKGKSVTSFPDDTTISMLKEKGANYTGKDVEVDGRMVTANGPSSAKKFGRSILQLLKG